MKSSKYVRNSTLAAIAGCIGLSLAPALHADSWDKKTVLTLGEAIQVPSCCTPDHTVILQPGEYVMVLMDSLSDRHIVRIFDKDQQHVITTILAIPNYRLQPTGSTVLQYWEVPAGQPRAIRAWFYPGDNFGQEFAYPKQTAVQIAAFVKAPVPTIEIETTAAEELKTTPLMVVDESGKSTQLMSALPVRTADVALVPVLQVEPILEQTADRTATPAELPHTASELPLIALAGTLSLVLFAGIGFWSRRRQLCRL